MTDIQTEDNNGLVISYLTLRKCVGLLGIILPIFLVIGSLLIDHCPTIKPSISDYYYTRVGDLLVGILCAISLFFFSYNGYDIQDKITSKILCVFALGIAFFPTNICVTCTACNIVQHTNTTWMNTVHFTSAAIFFLTLSYTSIFLFTKTSGDPTPEKLKRNKVYKICGMTIISSLLVILSLKIPFIGNSLEHIPVTLIAETIALWSFGLSWLTKGEFLLKDK